MENDPQLATMVHRLRRFVCVKCYDDLKFLPKTLSVLNVWAIKLLKIHMSRGHLLDETNYLEQ